MHTKTMEGLVGARTNMELLNTPMRVYRDARRRGDTAVMERAMAYAGDFSEKAEEYRKKADEGMEEDVKEAREKEKTMREESLKKRKEEKKKQEERIEEQKEARADTLEVSEEGRALAEDFKETGTKPAETAGTGGRTEPVIYTDTGEGDAVTRPEGGFSVSV